MDSIPLARINRIVGFGGRDFTVVKIPTSHPLRCGLLILSIVSLFQAAQASPEPTTPPITESSTPTPTAPPGPIVLWNQIFFPDSSSTGSQKFEPTWDALDDEAADDFVVPGNETWTVQEVRIHGVYFRRSTGLAPSVNLRFYFDSGTFPGAVVPGGTFLNVPVIDFLGDFIIPLPSDCVLTGGTYWMSVQANMNLTLYGQWGWTDEVFQSVSGAVWRNPAGGFGTACSDWGRRV